MKQYASFTIYEELQYLGKLVGIHEKNSSFIFEKEL